MNNNKKLLFLLATFTLLLVSVSAITAATADDSIIDDTSVSDDIIASDIESTQTTHEVVADNNNNKINTEKNKNLKSPGNTVVVTQDNVENVFGGENHTLNDSISQGDTLDFQGTIWIGEYDSTASAVIGHSLVINKPINVISSTADAIISLNTKAGSLLGEDPGASFVVNHGGSYSNISGLYLNNTECWIHYTDGVHFKNMTMHVENARVGSGVGQTAIRYTDNFLMEGCTIYTENNGGSSSFVVTAGNNITIKDTSIEGVGNVGNLAYLGNPYNTADVPKDENGVALYNISASNYGIQVINCTITCEGAAISIPIQNMGKNGTIANNTIYAKTGTISGGTNGTMYGNKLYFASGISTGAGTVAYDNEICGNGTLTTGANSTVYNNTAYNVALSAANVKFYNNTVLNRTTITQPVNLTENNLKYVVATGSNAKNSNITNNNITGFVNATAVNITIANNTINTTEEYAIYITGTGSKIADNTITTSTKAGNNAIYTTLTVDETWTNTPVAGTYNITDETYSNFFDENGVLNDTNIGDYSTIVLQNAFNDKTFTINNIKATIVGENCTINNGYIKAGEGSTLFIEDIIINNNEDSTNEYAIDLAGDFNIVKNVTINTNATSGVSRQIYVEGNNNTIKDNIITMSVPIVSMDYSQYPFAISNSAAITVLSSGNTIQNNVITATNSTESAYGTISVIDLASKTAAQNNTVTSNKINVNANGYVYGINLGSYTSYNTISKNTITATSDYYSNGVQIGYSPADKNIITGNTINLTSNIAYGVLCSAYGGIVSNSTITSNNIYVNATQSAAIEICGSAKEQIVNADISSNKIYSNGDYTIGIAVSGSNVTVKSNTIMVNGTTNATDDTSYDIIKPTTAGLISYNSDTVTISANTINVTSGANYILNSTSNSVMNGSSKINSDNTNIILENSNNINITGITAFTSSAYSVQLINSTNNAIYKNEFNASNTLGGNDAVSQDETSSDNTVENNTPQFVLLTDETYDDIFDENSTIKVPVDILILASDLYNKDLIFNNTITFKNQADYTIYNGTIYLEESINGRYDDRYVYIDGINFDNVNKAVLVDQLTTDTQRLVYFMNANVKVNGGVYRTITAFESVSEAPHYTQYVITNNTIIMAGDTVYVANMQRDTYDRDDYLDVEDNTISINATSLAVAVNAQNVNIDVINNDIFAISDEEVSLVNLTDVYANSGFFMDNSIMASGKDVTVVSLVNNHGTYPRFGENSIIVEDSENPVTVMYFENVTNVLVGCGRYASSAKEPNTITVDANNGETPLINCVDCTNSSVKFNYIEANDICGNDAVNADNIVNNTPYMTTLELEAPSEVGAKDTIVITASSLSGTEAVNGTITIYVDGIMVTSTEGNTLSYILTPEDGATYNVTATFYDSESVYKSSNASQIITVNTISPTNITVDEITATVGDTINITARVNSNDDAVNGGKVVFKVNGKTLKDENGKIIYAKVVDGVATIENYVVPDTWAKEGLTITAVYSGTSRYDSARSEETTITVQEMGGLDVSFTELPETIASGSEQTFTIKVTDGNALVETGKVVVKLGGKTLKDANGKIVYAKVEHGYATVTGVIPTLKAGTYELTALFTSTQYERTTATANVTVTRS